MPIRKIKSTTWMCTKCGKKQSTQSPRPLPGKCPKKSNGGPHTWVKYQ